MTVAVARRPVEQFETEVPMPDWQLEPEEEMWGLPNMRRHRRRWSTPTAIRSGTQPTDPLAREQPSRHGPDGTGSTSNGSTRCSSAVRRASRHPRSGTQPRSGRRRAAAAAAVSPRPIRFSRGPTRPQ